MNEELKEKYLKLFKEIDKDDTEWAHISADSLLTRLLEELWYSEVTEAYDEIDKWYS